MKFIAYNEINSQTYTFTANSKEEARQWIINHLDLSIEWTYKQIGETK